MESSLPRLDPDELRAFARRDWGRTAEADRVARARRPVEEKVAIAVQLYEATRRTRPDWPTDADRLADLASHQRVQALLARAPHVGAR